MHIYKYFEQLILKFYHSHHSLFFSASRKCEIKVELAIFSHGTVKHPKNACFWNDFEIFLFSNLFFSPHLNLRSYCSESYLHVSSSQSNYLQKNQICKLALIYALKTLKANYSETAWPIC